MTYESHKADLDRFADKPTVFILSEKMVKEYKRLFPEKPVPFECSWSRQMDKYKTKPDPIA